MNTFIHTGATRLMSMLLAAVASLFAMTAAAATTGTTAGVTAATGAITGFRSAQFGANEQAVRRAIEKDLGIKGEQLAVIDDPMLGVRVLSAELPVFAPLNAPAHLEYLLGATCRCLVRVGVQWKLPADDAARMTSMAGLGKLMNTLASKPWGQDKVVVNRVLGDVDSGKPLGVLLLRGEEGDTAVALSASPVILRKNDAKDKVGNNATEVTADIDRIEQVLLMYDANTRQPDVLQQIVQGF